MGRFTQHTIDRWAATQKWLFSGKPNDRIEDYMPGAKPQPVKKPSKKKGKT